MQDLSLHILDVAENAVRAGSKRIAISISQDEEKDLLTLTIEDDGKGMDAETVARALDPFFTTKEGKRVGLGLGLLGQAAQQTGGELTIDATEGVGTRIVARFKPGHPDMKPMGDIIETMATLVTANPDIRFVFDYADGEDHYNFDSRETAGNGAAQRDG